MTTSTNQTLTPDQLEAFGREMDDLRQRILADTRRNDLQPFTESLTVQHEPGFSTSTGSSCSAT